jgi:hypothetical protein
MKRGLVILITAVLLGVGMYFGSQRLLKSCTCEGSTQMPVESGSLLPELEWLRVSLQLSGPQFEKVRLLHLAYQPKCAELCTRIQHSDHALVEASARSRAMTAEVTQLLQERASLTQECQQAMLQHVYETAACMTPEQADKYLKIVLPQVLGPAHASH